MGDTSFSHEIKLGNIDKLNVNGNCERFQMLLDCYCCHDSCPCSRMLSLKHAVLPVGQPPLAVFVVLVRLLQKQYRILIT